MDKNILKIHYSFFTPPAYSASLLASYSYFSFSNLSLSAYFSYHYFLNSTLSCTVTYDLFILIKWGKAQIISFFIFYPISSVTGLANKFIWRIWGGILPNYLIDEIWFSLKFRYCKVGKWGNGLIKLFILLFLKESFFKFGRL